jgi:type IV pilus biogenesis protein CpaD/CtpE
MILSACDMTTPSQVKTGEMQLVDAMKTVDLDPTRVNVEQVNIIAGDYGRNSEGPMRHVLTYRPGNPLNKVAAESQGRKYAENFAKYGVKRLEVSYVESGDVNAKAVLSYMALKALPPRNCVSSSSLAGADTLENTENYGMGCTMQISQSQMISRPGDLMGTSGNPDEEAKRMGVIVDKYRSGVSNPPLQGLNASTVGSTSVSGGGVSTGTTTGGAVGGGS